MESDNEDIFDIEAQQYIPLEDLSQSIIIDNDDFISSFSSFSPPPSPPLVLTMYSESYDLSNSE